MLKEQGPLLAQLYLQLSGGGMNLISRVVLSHGMSHYTLVAYRQTVAVLAIAPFVVFFERKNLSALKLKHFGQIFLLAFLGIAFSHNLYYGGLAYTSTAFATTTNNLMPSATFLMAYLLRMERVDLRSRRGQAKVVGTVACVAGAMIMTLCKGPQLNWLRFDEKPAQPYVFLPSEVLDDHVFRPSTSQYWMLGAAMLFLNVGSWSGFVLYQAKIADEYPSQLTLSSMVLLMGSIQSLVIAAILEKPSSWKLGWDLQLLTVLYSAIFCSAIGMFVQMWSVKERGAVYGTAFNPLSTVLVAIFEPLLLHVPLHLGSLVGMVLVIGGLYCIVWGKALDHNKGTIITSGGAESADEDGITESLLVE